MRAGTKASASLLASQHVKGTHTYLELYRDGQRRGRIAQPHWDFLRQDALPSEAAVIHPGDALLTRCVFNTRNSTSLLPPYVNGLPSPGTQPTAHAPTPAAHETLSMSLRPRHPIAAGGEHDVVGGFGTYNAAAGHFEEMCYAFVLVWPRPRRSTCIDLKNTGWPGVIYCEEDAVHRMLLRNVIMQPSDPRTGKYTQFQLDRPEPAGGGAGAGRPQLTF
jgi:hypothetical protein